MIGTVIALRLLAVATEGTPAVVDEGPLLTIDPCVEVDEITVREVMKLELRYARDVMLPQSVSVRCVGEAQEIRIEPWASSEGEALRTIQLSPVAEDATPAARQARSRELALAIAELIRPLGIAPPPPPEPPAPPAPFPPTQAPVVAWSPPPSEVLRARWQLGVLPTFEYFAGGQMLAGGDLFLAALLHRWFLVELRTGGRVGAGQPLPGGRLTANAATAGVATGVVFWSGDIPVGAAIMLRAQGYLVRFRAERSGEDGAPTALLGAFVLAAEPRLMVALSRHFSLEAVAAVGAPLRGITVRAQGSETQSMSGLVVSGSLGGVLTF